MAKQGMGGSPHFPSKEMPRGQKGHQEAGSADFIAAHEAYLKGDAARLAREAQKLKKTPLEVYARYYQLSLALAAVGSTEGAIPPPLEKSVKDFLSRAEDTPLIDKLRGEWLKLLGKKQQWGLFDAEYPRLLNEDTELSCYELQSRRRSQEIMVLREARKLWFTGKGQPDNCGVLFDAALSAGIISEADIYRRLRLALEVNNVSLAIKLSDHLEGKSLARMLKSAAADPEHYLKKLKYNEPAFPKGTNMQLVPASGIPSVDPASGIKPLPPAAAPSPAAVSPPEPAAGWQRKFWSWLGLSKAESHPPTTDPAISVAAASSPASPPPPLSIDTQENGCEIACGASNESGNTPAVQAEPKRAKEGERLVAMFALQRLAKQSPDLAAAQWIRIAGYFPQSEQHYMYGRLAYEAARNLDARALQWYKAAADAPLDERQTAWRVRAALRAQEWDEVLSSVAAMNDKQQHEAAWQYWKARALQASGKSIEAKEILAPLSGGFNFYGQLAREELGDAPVLSESPPAYKPDQQAIAEMLALPGMQRTLALYRMGMHAEALDEWRWLLRNFNDRELLTAAEIARRNEMYDRAIGAAEKTVSLHDMSLRYPAPYRSELQGYIREHGLEEAWVYGLMRQESRFATGAKSGTGAVGLMQIMPDTARWVANKLGLRSYRNALIHQLDVNLRLGTYYMKSVLSRSENNPVLASAAYNAGPVRALQWRADRPLEGAIYVETIPFEETRDYVKKVMSNTAYYADQFGDPPRSLKQRMGIVPAKTAGEKIPAQTENNQPIPLNAN